MNHWKYFVHFRLQEDFNKECEKQTVSIRNVSVMMKNNIISEEIITTIKFSNEIGWHE